MKNLNELVGCWTELALKLKQKFSLLTYDDLMLDDDLFLMDGKREEMLHRLQIKLCRTKEEINKIILELISSETKAEIN